MAKKQKKKPVTTENPWFAIFRKQDAAYVLRMQEGILSDPEQVNLYFTAIRSIARLANNSHAYPYAITSMQCLLQEFRALPLQSISLLLEGLHEIQTKNPSGISCEHLLIHSLPEDTPESSLRLMNLFLDVADIQKVRTQDYPIVKGTVVLWIDVVRNGWFRALTRMLETQNAVPLLRLFELLGWTSGERKLEVLSPDEMGDLPVAHNEGFRIPCPPHAREWVESHLQGHRERIAKRGEQLCACAEHMRRHAKEYEDQYETMWLDLMLHPKWALRTGGLDCAKIEIPELRATGARMIHVSPLDDFPSFTATYVVKRLYTGEELFQFNLVPSHLRGKRDGPKRRRGGR